MFNPFKKRSKDTKSNTTPVPPTTEKPTPPTTSNQPGFSPLVKASMTLGVILLLGAIGTSGFLFKQVSDLKKNPTASADKEAQAIITAIGRHIILPTDELPTLATVSDPSKLQDQTFFVNAKIGDRVLVYTKAKIAILYDPSIDKIVTVAPVSITPTTDAVSGSSTTTNSSTTKK